MRARFFTNRVFPLWKQLSEHAVNSSNVGGLEKSSGCLLSGSPTRAGKGGHNCEGKTKLQLIPQISETMECARRLKLGKPADNTPIWM